MNIIKTDIPDVLILNRACLVMRGVSSLRASAARCLMRLWAASGIRPGQPPQSQKGVLRGLHYQLDPHAQGKLVRCVEGEVFDVAVDIRRSSPTFGKWWARCSAQRINVSCDPGRFAHGLWR